MKLIDRLPYFPMYAKDYLYLCRNYDIVTFGVLTKLICETWARECEWLSDTKEDIPKILNVRKKDYEHAKKEIKFKFLAADKTWYFKSLASAKDDAENRHQRAKKAANIRHGNY